MEGTGFLSMQMISNMVLTSESIVRVPSPSPRVPDYEQKKKRSNLYNESCKEQKNKRI